MDIVTLKKQIKTGELDQFYVFTGEDTWLMNLYIKQMAQKNNHSVQRVDAVADVWKYLTQKSLTSKNKSNIYVVRDDKQFMTSENAWAGIGNIRNGILIVLVTKADNRSKFVNTFKETIITFDKMTTKQAVSFFTGRCTAQLTNDIDFEYFVERCGNDCGRIALEVDKLNHVGCVVTKQIVDELLNTEWQPTAFDYGEYVLACRQALSIESLETLLRNGESGVMLLGILFNNFNNCVLIAGHSGKGVQEDTGVNGYIANKLKQLNAYNNSELLKILRIIQKYELGIKKGIYEEQYAIRACTIEILTVA